MDGYNEHKTVLKLTVPCYFLHFQMNSTVCEEQTDRTITEQKGGRGGGGERCVLVVVGEFY